MTRRQLSVCLLCCVFLITMRPVETTIRLVNNGYEGVIVYISAAVTEDQTLIYDIKDMMISASHLLFYATKQRAYFRTVTIVIPQTWTSVIEDITIPTVNKFDSYIRIDKPATATGHRPYDMMTSASHLLFFATKQRAYFRTVTIVIPQTWTSVIEDITIPTVNKFDSYIRIDKPATATGHRPYVRGNSRCGESAWYMHLTPSFVNRFHADTYGQPDRAVVHEWGHLRWGLFDEYASIAYASTAPYKTQFYNGGGEWNAVTCPRSVAGNAYSGNCDPNQPCNVDNLTIDKTCKFCPNTQQTVEGSFMAHQWMSSVVRFCEKDVDTTPDKFRHNSDATNLHNKMCNGRSAWEVMEEHEDFRDGNNPAVSLRLFEEPTYIIAKERSKVRVFVYDVSGSMNANGKITKQRDASFVVIDSVVETGSYLGLVKFTDVATTLREITHVTNTAVREDLKTIVPSTAGGGTQIYEGLKEAISVIERSGFPTAGSEIVLLSDGESNSPYMHINATLIEKEIIVHTIAITNAADPLMALLAEMTGGNSYTYLETHAVSFADVFTQAVSGTWQSESAAKTLLGSSYTLSSTSPINGLFFIDDGIGQDTTLTVIHSSSTTISIEIVAPDSSVFTSQDTASIVTLRLDGLAQTGEYSYTISTSSIGNIDVEITVSSSPTSADVDVIDVTSFVNSSTLDLSSTNQVVLTANVQKGQSPVLNANVTAVLAADTSYTPISLTLLDSGTGADPIYGDGIYNTFLLKRYFTVDSAYNIKITVQANGQAFTQYMANGADAMPGTVDDTNVTNEDVGNFTRQSIPGEITTTNFTTNPVDTTPPAQIFDLRVENIYKVTSADVESLIYTLVWTAVGSDMDVGQAQSYDMRFHADIQTLSNNFTSTSQVPETLQPPQISGETETVNITFTHEHCVGICYLAVIATDENGLSGDISNIINVDIDFSYIVGDIPVIEDSTKKSIVLLLVLIVLGIVFALAILGGIVFKIFHGTGKRIGTERVDPVFRMEQADNNEKQRFSNYDQDHKDAAVSFDNSDFNARPSFFETIHMKEAWGYPDGNPFAFHDDDALSVQSDDHVRELGVGEDTAVSEYSDPIFAVETCDGNSKRSKFVVEH